MTGVQTCALPISLEALAERGEFSPPRLATLEEAAAYGVSLQRGRVFADLWDLEKFFACPECFGARKYRLERMNFTQTIEPSVVCSRCNDLVSAGASPSR